MTTASPEAFAEPDIVPSDSLPRRLGFWATTAVVVGTIIGSGIFRVPASVAAEVGSATGIALVWILGGVISLCGALVELERKSIRLTLPMLGELSLQSVELLLGPLKL